MVHVWGVQVAGAEGGGVDHVTLTSSIIFSASKIAFWASLVADLRGGRNEGAVDSKIRRCAGLGQLIEDFSLDRGFVEALAISGGVMPNTPPLTVAWAFRGATVLPAASSRMRVASAVGSI